MYAPRNLLIISLFLCSPYILGSIAGPAVPCRSIYHWNFREVHYGHGTDLVPFDCFLFVHYYGAIHDVLASYTLYICSVRFHIAVICTLLLTFAIPWWLDSFK